MGSGPREACRNVLAPESVSQWEGQNRCWEWMKISRCNGEDDEVTWSEAQDRAAKIKNGSLLEGSAYHATSEPHAVRPSPPG